MLRGIILRGWPESREEVPECARPYFDVRHELTFQDETIFKGPQLMVPAALRRELLEKTHATHVGIEGCIRRARDTLYWPRMSTEIREYITKCDICMAHSKGQAREPMMQHDFMARPWSKVAADLCDLDGRTLLVVSDYYSNYIEVARLSSTTSRAIIKELKAIFARFGIPDCLVTDNGPQFSAAEFSVFAKTWMFEHRTSSPSYAQSNGKAENAVQTIKRLFTKCKASGVSEFQALLDWRNTPTAGIGTSPAQRLMGRRCKTLLPVAGSLLQPRYSTEEETRRLIGAKERQRHYYDRQTKTLPPIRIGEPIHMRLPGEKTWSAGTCTGLAGPRSYEVQVGAGVYRRNWRHLNNVGTAGPNLAAEEVVPDELPTMQDSAMLHAQPEGPTPVVSGDTTAAVLEPRRWG